MSETKEERKRSPNLDLKQEKGMYVIGVFQGRYESKNFPGKYSSLISVIETNGSTTLYDRESDKNVETDIQEGDNVFLSESTWLARFMGERSKGDKIKITYTGKGKAKKGQKAPYTYSTEVLGE